MAKHGLLYLHNGLWDGQQLVPAGWVESSITAQGDEAYFEQTGQSEVIEWYGYQWWTWKPEWFYGYRSFQAKGYGGQQVLIFPELDLFLVTTANRDGVDPTTADEQETAINELILDKIFPLLVNIE
jgi:CubicO group peptidase (beta-lactamase class C family)